MSVRAGRAHWAIEVPLLVGALLGATLIAYANSNYGPGILQTALNGFYAAESVLAGETMQMNRGGAPFTLWPPLQPWLLAVGRGLGLSYRSTGLWINVIAQFTLLYLSAKILLRFVSIWTALAGVALLILSADLFWSASVVSFEPFFGALIVASVYALVLYLERPAWQYWVAAVLVMLACLHRYVGIALIAAGALVLLGFPNTLPLRVRLRRSFAFSIVAIVPLGIWLVRNHFVKGPMRDEWPTSQRGFLLNVHDTWRSVMQFAGRGPETFNAAEFLALLAFLAAFALLVARAVRLRDAVLTLYLCFPTFYIVFLVVIASNVNMDPVNVRFLEPVAAFLVGLLLLGTKEAWSLLRARPMALRVVACLPFLFPLAFYVHTARTRAPYRIRESMENGAGGMGTREWVATPLFAWLDEHPMEGEVYSNVPEIVLVAGDRRAKMVTPETLAAALEAASKPAWLVWQESPGGPWPPLPTLPEGSPLLVPVAELDNGDVFRVERR